MLSFLFSDPSKFFVWLLAIAYGITVHEFAHALAAYWQGDNTAKDAGRLTLNPLAHIDYTGLIVLIVAGFGWGRSTPVNPRNFLHGKTSDNLVSFAGIFFNIVSFFVFAFALKAAVLYAGLADNNFLVIFLSFLMLINLSLAVFNILPIPPLDGSHLLFNLLPDRFNQFKLKFAANGPWILLMLILADNLFDIGIFQRIFLFFFGLVNNFL